VTTVLFFFPENQLTKKSPGGGVTTLGGGTPDTGCRTPFRPVVIRLKRKGNVLYLSSYVVHMHCPNI